MKSFRKVFSELDKIVRETVIRFFNVTDFYPGFYRAYPFVDRREIWYFLGYCACNLGILKVFKVKI